MQIQSYRLQNLYEFTTLLTSGGIGRYRFSLNLNGAKLCLEKNSGEEQRAVLIARKPTREKK